MRGIVWILVVAVAGCAGAPREESSVREAADTRSALDRTLDGLTAQILEKLADESLSTAVLPFLRDGGETQFGNLASEKLTTRIVRSGHFKTVATRADLDRVLSENKLQLGELVDAATSQPLGRLLGVQSIIVGSLTVGRSTVWLNASVLEVETAAILAVAEGELPMDESIAGLLGAAGASVVAARQDELTEYERNWVRLWGYPPDGNRNDPRFLEAMREYAIEEAARKKQEALKRLEREIGELQHRLHTLDQLIRNAKRDVASFERLIPENPGYEHYLLERQEQLRKFEVEHAEKMAALRRKYEIYREIDEGRRETRYPEPDE